MIIAISGCQKDGHRLTLVALDPNGEPVPSSYLMVFSTDTICDTADVGMDLHHIELKEGWYQLKLEAPLYKTWMEDSFYVSSNSSEDSIFVEMEYSSESLLEPIDFEYIGHPY